MSRLRALLVALLALALTMAGVAVASAAAPATATATVVGVITADGAPVTDASVTASLPPGVSGSWPQVYTDDSGHYSLPVTVLASGSTTLTLDIVDHAEGSHRVSQETTVTLTPNATVTKDAVLSSFDARLVATVSGVPAGVDPGSIDLSASQLNTNLWRNEFSTGGPIELDGLAGASYAVEVDYGWGTPKVVMYPGTTDGTRETPLVLQAGCTTTLAVNLTAATMSKTRDCARLPACQAANAALASATSALAPKTRALATAKKKYKKAKKKYKRHHLSKKQLKKAKKKVTKATAAQKKAAATRAAAAATAQRTCH